MNLLFIYWNSSRTFFSIPVLDIPITFYGFLFSTGFILSANLFFYIIRKTLLYKDIFISSIELDKFFDKLSLCCCFSLIIGARISHILFYDLPFYLENPFRMLKIWEGGLSSYGGIVAIFLCSYFIISFYKKKIPFLSFFLLADAISIVFGIFSSMVRLGNFFNQEIIGIKTNMPWGVYFGNSFYCMKNGPVHPVQLYEAIFYMCTSISLFLFWRLRKDFLGKGYITAVSCIVLSLGRFILEFYKEKTSLILPKQFVLNMGQILALPFFFLGVFFLVRMLFFSKRINLEEKKN